jgi:hypothetical protein
VHFPGLCSYHSALSGWRCVVMVCDICPE